MMAKSWRGVAVGAFIALIVPISFLILAGLVNSGIVSYDQTGDGVLTLATTSLTLQATLMVQIALSEVFLGPIGIVIAGRSASLRGAIAWLLLIIVAVPGLAFVWFYCILILSGALGYPL